MEPAAAPDVSSDEHRRRPGRGDDRRLTAPLALGPRRRGRGRRGDSRRGQPAGGRPSDQHLGEPPADAHSPSCYFTHPDDLPQRLTAPGPDTFSFTIANREGRTTDYPYTVTLASPEFTSVVSQGTLRVADGGATVKPVDLFPLGIDDRLQGDREVGQPREVIHFQGGAE